MSTSGSKDGRFLGYVDGQTRRFDDLGAALDWARVEATVQDAARRLA